jgi:tetratricopeptide (TPR) repeat protein
LFNCFGMTLVDKILLLISYVGPKKNNWIIMKTSNIKKGIALLFCAVFVSSMVAFAGGILEDKTTEKTREAVENASPDDWYTLAKSADKCFDKKVNLKEASQWIDQSLDITEAPYNLEVKGNYYMLNNLPEKALEYYVKAVRKANSDDPTDGENIQRVQKKIAEITEIGR